MAATTGQGYDMTGREAAGLLRCDPETVRVYAAAGVLSSVTRTGQTGRGRKRYYDRAEVEAFRARGAAGAEAYRAKRARREARR